MQHDFTVPSAATVPLKLPVADPFTATYWSACRERRLLIRRCGGCGTAHHPPRPLCPVCWSDDVVWQESSGRGVVYSWSVVRENDLAPFREALPYVVAVVELAEGPRLMTTIVDSEPDRIEVGAPAMVVFSDRDGWTFPAFRVVDS
jgi:uncharacterized OB-fold protein